MSSFGGILEDIPGISIDHFEGANLNSSIFFLSHCHTDHMQGLNNYFYFMLKTKKCYLYCSPISKKVLQESSNVRALDMYTPETLTYTLNNEITNVTVTCYPSGHCPGSVMFLFEKDDLSILFTGDFRYNVHDLTKMKLFQSYDGFSKKRFTKVYLDTTFLSPKYPRFPSREDSAKELVRICRDWLDSDPKHVVSMNSPPYLGQEYIYKRLGRALGMKVHVVPKLYEMLVQIEVTDYVTDDISSRIHDCHPKGLNYTLDYLPCNKGIRKEDVLVIKPSAMIWNNWNGGEISMRNPRLENMWNVCYATHSSFEELGAFIEHIKCESIIPFVCPKDWEMENLGKLIEVLRGVEEEEKDAGAGPSCRLRKAYLDEEFKSEYLSSDEDC